jgi:soluble lytic murein transglycosylase-like protein
MPYDIIILAAAKAAKVSGSLLLAICMHETGLKNVTVRQDGGSPTYGLCQVKYETAQGLGYDGMPDGLLIPETNAKYAALYLKKQLIRYDYDQNKAVAAYNAGRYNESTKYPGYPKNLKYVKKVLEIYAKNNDS